MTTIAILRALIQDTTATPILSDEDIEVIIEVESNVYYAASLCCNSIAAYYSSKTDMTVDVIKIANSQKFEHYTALAKVYAQRGKEGGGEGGSALIGTGVIATGISESEIASVESDSDRMSSSFTIGMFENIEDDSGEVC